MTSDAFRVMHVDLGRGSAQVIEFGSRRELIGGSGLGAALFREYARTDEDWDHPDQPLVFAIGPLTGYFPLMSKVVCSFFSPYHNQYAESHAGGRLALSMRFAGYDAVMFTGASKLPVAVKVSGSGATIEDVNYLWGANAFTTGRLLRRAFPGGSGHRSIMRIGPAGETLSAYACINVDTYRHFGRLGSGTAMGAKKLKGVIVHGDEDFELPGEGKEYAKLFKKVYDEMTATHMMSKYHDLGTPQNLVPLNELSSLPWRNLKQTSDPAVTGISGETFAEELLMRNAACSGCPVGCIHVGMLREQFAEEHRFQYRTVSYDYEPIFAAGSMLGVTDASDVLAIMDEVEKQGLDVMSAGVALAWATEAMERGVIDQETTGLSLCFGDAEAYKEAVWLLGHAKGEFWANLARGAMAAAEVYGGQDYACVLGQEMAGYATGEVFFTAQSLGLRHSHLDTGGYSYDQKVKERDVDKAMAFLLRDEQERCLLTSMVSCLFARNVYTPELVQECLRCVGLDKLADNLEEASAKVQRIRWRARFETGFDPASVKLPKRFSEVVTWKGEICGEYLDDLRREYGRRIERLGSPETKE